MYSNKTWSVGPVWMSLSSLLGGIKMNNWWWECIWMLIVAAGIRKTIVRISFVAFGSIYSFLSSTSSSSFSVGYFIHANVCAVPLGNGKNSWSCDCLEDLTPPLHYQCNGNGMRIGGGQRKEKKQKEIMKIEKYVTGWHVYNGRPQGPLAPTSRMGDLWWS